MIDYNEFLTCAEAFYTASCPYNDDTDNIVVRNCISRAFYYVFHHIRERFRKHPKANFDKFPNQEQRKAIVDFFNDIHESKLASRFLNLNRKRNIADYDIDKEVIKSDAEVYLKEVRTFVERTNRISPI